MRIAFVNPPRLSRGRAIQAEDCCWGAGALVLPSMLLSCATEAAHTGHEVAFIDLVIDDPATLSDFKPDLIVHALAWQWSIQINHAMTEVARDVRRLVIAVPPGYAMRYAGIWGPFQPFAVAYSEPEMVCANLPQQAEDLDQWCWNAPGIAYAGLYNILHQNDSIRNCLHELRPTDYPLVPGHYWEHYRAACYQVTRGCPYKCTFCVWGGSTVTDTTFRMRPASVVAHDLAHLRGFAGRDIPLYLLAAQLTTSQRWITEFHHEMQEKPYPFQSNVNVKDVTDGKLEMLQGAGLVSAATGLDGASDGVLKLMNKPYDMECAVAGLQVMQRARMLKRVRVRYGVGESQDDVEEAMLWIDRMQEAGIKKMRVNFAPIIHYEGTVAYQKCQYALRELPSRGVAQRLVQARPADWQPYIEKLRGLGWLGRVGARK